MLFSFISFFCCFLLFWIFVIVFLLCFKVFVLCLILELLILYLREVGELNFEYIFFNFLVLLLCVFIILLVIFFIGEFFELLECMEFELFFRIFGVWGDGLIIVIGNIILWFGDFLEIWSFFCCNVCVFFKLLEMEVYLWLLNICFFMFFCFLFNIFIILILLCCCFFFVVGWLIIGIVLFKGNDMFVVLLWLWVVLINFVLYVVVIFEFVI